VGRVEKEERGRLARAIVRCAPYGECGGVEGYEDLVEAVRRLRRRFRAKPASWFYRAVYRGLGGGVRRVGRKHWLVRGFRELGDEYPYYNVWIFEKKYRCDCFYRSYGYVRKARICTHIAAVLLYRRRQLRLEV